MRCEDGGTDSESDGHARSYRDGDPRHHAHPDTGAKPDHAGHSAPAAPDSPTCHSRSDTGGTMRRIGVALLVWLFATVAAAQDNCCTAHPESMGCTDATCQTCVCGIDPLCCSTMWDYQCSLEAQGLYDPTTGQFITGGVCATQCVCAQATPTATPTPTSTPANVTATPTIQAMRDCSEQTIEWCFAEAYDECQVIINGIPVGTPIPQTAWTPGPTRAPDIPCWSADIAAQERNACAVDCCHYTPTITPTFTPTGTPTPGQLTAHDCCQYGPVPVCGTPQAGVCRVGAIVLTNAVCQANGQCAPYTPLPSETPTETPVQAASPEVETPFIPFTPTPTPFIPVTVTPTFESICAPFTPTPTPPCPTTYITGQASDVNGVVAGHRRVTIEVVREQVVGGCLIHISHTTTTTDANGYMDPQLKGVAGSVIHLTIEDDVPIEAVLPQPPSVKYADLIKTGHQLR